MPRTTSLTLVCSLLAGCGIGEGVGSWRDAAFGLVSEDEFSALERVLESAEGTPGNQGLLYVAMVEAEAASQSASRAVARSGSSAALTTALGQVIYALRPEAAPEWDAMESGLVPGWTGQGYGMLWASEEMIGALRTAAASEGGDAAGEALTCAENAFRLGERSLELAQSLLAAEVPGDQEARLVELERLAKAQLQGLDADGDGTVEITAEECALQQVRAILEPLDHQSASYSPRMRPGS